MRFQRPTSFYMVKRILKDSSHRLMYYADYELFENIVRSLLLEDHLRADQYLICGTREDNSPEANLHVYNVKDFSPRIIQCAATKRWDHTSVAFIAINARLGIERKSFEFNTQLASQGLEVPYRCPISPDDHRIRFHGNGGPRGEDSLTNYFDLDAGRRMHRAMKLGVLGDYDFDN